MASDKEYAEGIPDRSEYGDIGKLKQDDISELLVQSHDADKAGPHKDIRLYSPREQGYLSWAFRKGVPEKGKKHLGVRTQLHSPEYRKFEGDIKSGYGKGRVKKDRLDKALITSSDKEGITFVTGAGTPEKFRLQKTDRGWLLYNIPQDNTETARKPDMITLDPSEADKVFSPGNVVMSKIDGSFNVSVIKDKIKDLSHRKSKKTGKPIEHTYRTGGYKISPEGIPEDTALLSELYAEDKKGNVLPAAVLGSILNSRVAESAEKQRDRGIKLKRGVFDIARYGGEDVSDKPYRERRKLLKNILKKLPEDQFRLIKGETDPRKQKKMWEKILGGKHPLTSEGVVSYPLEGGKPEKVKTYNEYDVVLVEPFREVNKEGEPKDRAGGFYYRYPDDPEGTVRGKIGTGLEDEEKRDMWDNPGEWKGRRVRVRAQRKEPESGALYAPRYIARHESY